VAAVEAMVALGVFAPPRTATNQVCVCEGTPPVPPAGGALMCPGSEIALCTYSTVQGRLLPIGAFFR
jgi:hypothetical protein